LGPARDRVRHDGRVRRTVPLVALWLAAGAAATTVAWWGVSTVSEQLAGSNSHPAPLSAEDIREELAAAPTATSTTVVPAPATSTSTSSTLPTTATTTVTSPPPVTTVPATTTVPTAPQPVTRSYDLVGGSATLRFSPTGVTVVVATPAPGFTVDVTGSHSSGVRVEFEGDDHRSRVEGWWDDGPRDEVREEG
jgi:hypothetical protein